MFWCLSLSSNFTFLIASPSVISLSWITICTFPCYIPMVCKQLTKWRDVGPAPCWALSVPAPEIAKVELLGGCATTCLLCLQVGRSCIKQAGDPPGLCLPAVQNCFQLGCVANLQGRVRCGNRCGWPMARAIHSFIQRWRRQNAEHSMLSIFTPRMHNLSK